MLLEMYNSINRGGSSKAVEMTTMIVDRKRINDAALDKHIESSPTPTSKGFSIKGKGNNVINDNNSKDMLSGQSMVTGNNIGRDGKHQAWDQRDSRSASVSNNIYSDEESETDSEESDVGESDEEDTSWISWFCSLRGNEFYCEVDEDYIQDDFNLSGLRSQVPYYDDALDLILDVESSNDEMFTEEQNESIESAAEMLYGLIHARYILTSNGMGSMLEKYKDCDFGNCPRVYCCGQSCLPVGQSDVPQSSTVKIYCPECEDIYYPRTKHQGNIDAAHFGTTFPHLFLMSYPHLKPKKQSQIYIPRVYGFKVHNP